HSVIAASMAPTARPYLKPDDAPCFGIACARSIRARSGLCRSMKLRMAATSTRSLAPTPTTGMSMHSISTGAAPLAISMTANPPLMPGSTPKTFMPPVPPLRTETRRGVLVLSLTMSVSPKEGASPEGDAVSSLRSNRAREFATLLADRWHYGLIPDFGHADSPAEVRALPRRPAPPARYHLLNSDALCLLSLSRLACGCQ